MKYGLLWTAENVVQNMNVVLDKRIYSTGLVNWPRLFDGRCYRARRINPNDFDVLHVQLTGDTLDVVRDIRSRITGNTKLVVNPDYALEYWYQFGTVPETVIDCLKQADFVFGQCSRTAEFLSELLHKDVPMIPHPLDTRWLANHAIPAGKRSKSDVMINTHRDNCHHTPYFITREQSDVVTHLIGFRNESGFRRDVVHQYYDHVHVFMSNADLIDKVYRNAFCVIDHYTHSVQGRSTMQLAALGVPCLGWENVDAQLLCFPELTSATGDVADQMRLFRRLREDEDFLFTVSAEAMKKAETYSFENCRNKFMDMIKAGESDAGDKQRTEAAD